jgi:hypothetical protein
MSILGFARVQTDLNGRVFNISYSEGVDYKAEDVIHDFEDEIYMWELDNFKDSDVLVTIHIGDVGGGFWDEYEVDVDITLENVVLLRSCYRNVLCCEIAMLDNELTHWSGDSKSKDEAETYLMELHDMYLKAYGEEPALRSFDKFEMMEKEVFGNDTEPLNLFK